MMIAKHRKTYTLEVEIDKFSDEYAMFREAHDKAKDEPFLHIEEIGDIIERDLRPLVPFKKVYGWGFRLNVTGRDKVVIMTVTFNLADHTEIDFIR